MRVVAAIDKFRGTASASDAAAAVCRAAAKAGWKCDPRPMADGGEGTLEALGGPNRRTIVMGPLGDPVEAEWRLSKRTAVIEMARASGLTLVGGAEGNDPIAASTHGTGELDRGSPRSGREPRDRRRRRIGDDRRRARCDPSDLPARAACAASSCSSRATCARRSSTPPRCSGRRRARPRRRSSCSGDGSERLAQIYLEEYGVDVRAIEGSGRGRRSRGWPGRARRGAGLRLRPRRERDRPARRDRRRGPRRHRRGLPRRASRSRARSSVASSSSRPRSMCRWSSWRARCSTDASDDVDAISLVDRFGRERALADTVACIEEVVLGRLSK